MAVDAKSINIHMQVTGPFPAQMAAAGASVQTFGNQANAGMAKAQSGMARFGAVASKIGAVSAIGLAIGLGLSAKAAIDFESSFAGVKKTVDATEPQFERLAMGIRDMAKEIPIGVNELNRIAELGGQLGVDQGGLLEFTEVIAKLGVTTTLSTEEAAIGFARIDNIMQTGQAEFGNMGAAIVELGNNFATTESEILNFATRIAPIGKTVGLTTDEIFAISAAFSSVGIPAERGGTALQKVFLRISDAALDGGAQLDTFADVAGLTADEFQRLAKGDPAAALQAFIVGLDGVIQSGESTTPIFEALNLSNERVRNSMLAMANASNVLVDALASGEMSYREMNALNEEAAKRFETTASQLGILKNQLVDIGITVGTELLPVIITFIEGIQVVGGFIGGMSTPVKQLGLAFVGLSAAMWLAFNHPVIAIIGLVASAIFFLGKQAQRAAERVATFQGILDRGFAFEKDLRTALGDPDYELLIDIGFNDEEISRALTGTIVDFEAFSKEVNAAFNALGRTDAPIFLEVFRKTYRKEFQDLQNEATEIEAALSRARRFQTPDLPGEKARLQALERRKNLLNEIRDSRLGLDDADERIRYEKIFPVFTPGMVEDVGDALDKYQNTISDGFTEVEDRIKSHIDLLFEFDDEYERAWGELLASAQRSITAALDFDNVLEGLGLDELSEEYLRTLVPSAQDKEEFVKAFFAGLFPDGTDFNEFIETVIGFAEQVNDAIFNTWVTKKVDFEFTAGQDLLDDLAAAAKEVDNDPDNTYNPYGIWLGIIKETLAQAPTEEIKNRILGVLRAALSDPAFIASTELTRSAIQALIDLLDQVSGTYIADVIIRTQFPADWPDTVEPAQRIQPKRAFGGSVLGGTPTMVGEHGPELFVPFSNGTIVSNNKLGGGGETNYELNIYGSEDVVEDGRVTLLTAQTIGAF